MKNFKKDNLNVNVYDSRNEMGKAAALDIKNKIVELLSEKNEINMIFAAAPSQNEVLASLVEDKDIEWGRINAYHMDEYIGLPAKAPQAFGNFLRDHIFGLVPFKSVNYIDITAKDPEKESKRYGKLLEDNPTDIVVMGIGENGHIAFNDPPVADFCDKCKVKPVKLDEVCRNQQVNDGCFNSIDEVPRQAITMGMISIMQAKKILLIANGKAKKEILEKSFFGPITPQIPASILQLHPDITVVYSEE